MIKETDRMARDSWRTTGATFERGWAGISLKDAVEGLRKLDSGQRIGQSRT